MLIQGKGLNSYGKKKKKNTELPQAIEIKETKWTNLGDARTLHVRKRDGNLYHITPTTEKWRRGLG